MKNKNNAFIEFSDPDYADFCVKIMNQQLLGENEIMLTPSRNLFSLDLSKNFRSPQARLYNQALIVDKKFKRFEMGFQTEIHPPSNQLLAVCERSMETTPRRVAKMISAIEQFEEIEVLSQNNSRLL